MNKRIILKSRAKLILIVITLVIFSTGFFAGRYSRAATNDELQTDDGVITCIDTVASAQEAPTPQYNELTVTATAYCPCVKCCGKTDGITATGTKATAGRTIAVDPSIIPFGTEVIINGNTYIAEDRGGVIKGNKVDIFFDTHEEALQFGRRVLTAHIEK